MVLDVFSPIRGRARPERLAYLAAMDNDDPQAALQSLLALGSPLNLTQFAQNRNLQSIPTVAVRLRFSHTSQRQGWCLTNPTRRCGKKPNH